MSGVITTTSFAKSLFPGVNKWYGEEYEEFKEEWPMLFEKFTSKRAWEEDVGISGFGLLTQKSEGSGITYDNARQGFTTRYNHVVYASGFVVTREAFEDDIYDIIAKQKSKSLAFSVRQSKEVIAANVYNRAFNTLYLGGDGVTMIASAGGGGSTAHPLVAGGTFTNGISVASDLSEASLEQCVIDLGNFVSDRGLKIAVRPKRLIIPKELQFEAHRILMSADRVGTDNNDVNAIKAMGSFPEIHMNHYLTDPDAWFVMTDVKDGMKYFERRPDEFTTDDDFDTENAKYKATFRCSFGWTDPRGIYGSPGA